VDKPPVELPTLLTGAHVRLWPWVRGLYGRDDLYHVWRLIEQEPGAVQKLFYTQQCADESQRGDLQTFCEYMSSRLLLLAQSVTDQQLIGCVWFEDVVPDWRATISMFYRRTYWGTPAREATRLAVRYAFEVLQVPQVWGITPQRLALRHGLALGFTHLATLPGYVRLAGQPRDVFVLRLTHDEFTVGEPPCPQPL
jgi:RimJ/RimL family protein N-acetyltransferase